MAPVKQLITLWEGLGSSLGSLSRSAGRLIRRAKRNRKGGVQKSRAERVKKTLVVSEPKAPAAKPARTLRVFSRRPTAPAAGAKGASAKAASQRQRQQPQPGSATASAPCPKQQYQFVNPNAWRFDVALPRDVLLSGASVPGLEDFGFITERRPGVLTAADMRSGRPVIIQLLPRGRALPADAALWALYQQRLGTGHPHVQQLQEVRLLGNQLAVVLEHGISSVQALVHHTRTKGAIPPEAAVRRLFQQLILGLQFCHRHGLERCSLHPADLALHGPLGGGDVGGLTLKLHDFSCSGLTGGGDASNDPAFLAPEVLAGQLHGDVPPAQWKAADVWSAGAVLFALLTGEPPFEGTDNSGRIPPPVFSCADGVMPAIQQFISAGCVDLLRGMLDPVAASRATLLQITAHPWFRQDLPPALASLNGELLACPPQLEAPLQSPRTQRAMLASLERQLGRGSHQRQAAASEAEAGSRHRPPGVTLRQHHTGQQRRAPPVEAGAAQQPPQPRQSWIKRQLHPQLRSPSRSPQRRRQQQLPPPAAAAEAAALPAAEPQQQQPASMQPEQATTAPQAQASQHPSYDTPVKQPDSQPQASSPALPPTPQQRPPAPPTPQQLVQRLKAGSTTSTPRSILDDLHGFGTSSASSLAPSDDLQHGAHAGEECHRAAATGAATLAHSSGGSLPLARGRPTCVSSELQPAPLPAPRTKSAAPPAPEPASAAASDPEAPEAPATPQPTAGKRPLLPASQPPAQPAASRAASPSRKPKLPPLLLPPRDGRRQSTAELVALVAKAATTGGGGGRHHCSTAARQLAALQHMLRLHSIYQDVAGGGRVAARA